MGGKPRADHPAEKIVLASRTLKRLHLSAKPFEYVLCHAFPKRRIDIRFTYN
jgi:hypothetical protein